MKDLNAIQIIETTALRRRLKDLEYSAVEKPGIRSMEVEKEIHEIKRKLSSYKQPVMPKKRKPSAGNCINPKCLKRINYGQSAVKYGQYGLCCNFKCLSEAMARIQ